MLIFTCSFKYCFQNFLWCNIDYQSFSLYFYYWNRCLLNCKKCAVFPYSIDVHSLVMFPKYNTIITMSISSKNPHKKHTIACPLGQGMENLLWVQPLINILILSVRWFMQYHITLDHIITALGFTWFHITNMKLPIQLVMNTNNQKLSFINRWVSARLQELHC